MSRDGIVTIAIILPYWLGIAADTLWAAALFVPWIFGTLTGATNFDPDQDYRLTMAIAGVLMAGWTILLLWAVKEPLERRFVILLTAFPVIFGLFAIALVRVLQGNSFQVWILAKTAILFVSMIGSYVLASRIVRKKQT